MIREAYKVVTKFNEYPEIVKVPVTDLEGVSWQAAKKECRRQILAEAKALRSLSVDSYFAEYENGN